MLYPEEPILRAKDVGISYREGRRIIPIVDGVNFSMGQGEKIAIIGVSGCGKTTLLDAVLGFTPISQGELLCAGVRVSGPGSDRMAVFQDVNQLIPHKTVLENVIYSIRRVSGKTKKEAFDEAMNFLDLVNVVNHVNSYPATLSGGTKQRVAIARAMAVNPKILVMDEPFSGVDEQNRERIQQEFNKIWLKQGSSVVMVTHSIREAIGFADQVIVMGNYRPSTVKAIITTECLPDDIWDTSVIEMEKYLCSLINPFGEVHSKCSRQLTLQKS